MWLNDVAVSWGRDGMTRVVIESVEEIAYGRLEMQHSYSSKNFSINVHDVRGQNVDRRDHLVSNGGDDSPTTITCEKATMHSDVQDNTLTFSCTNSDIIMPDGTTIHDPNTQTRHLVG